MNKSQTFLLVDDNRDNLYLMRAAFEMADCKNPLQEVHDGAQAIAYLQGDKDYSDRARFPLPTVMLLDLSMRKKNGFEVLTWLRAQPGLKRLTTVVFTASVRKEDVERAFDMGANSYLVKPLTLDELANMLRRLNDWVQITQYPSLQIEA